MPVDLREVKTPAALVDLEVLERNCARMSARAGLLGVKLRPHVKTHKCLEIARLQTRGHDGAISVSTMAEARGFAEAGFTDITYTVPIPFPAIPEAADLLRRGVRLSLLLDSEAALLHLDAFGGSQAVRFPAFLKVDCGYHRAGVNPENPESAALAQRMALSEHVAFLGLLTHAGHAYPCKSREEILAVAEQERSVMARFARKLDREGIPVHEVSTGSTPTCSVAETLSGITEIRPGNYVFHDAFQAAIGCCSYDDARAFTVLATVIGSYAERGELLFNAGALALSKDGGPSHVDPACGFGIVCDLGGKPMWGLKITALSQEHGMAKALDRKLLDRLPVGSAIRIIPNHSCLAAACFDRYLVLRGGEVADEWKTVRGW